jgi:serine protease AprX
VPAAVVPTVDSTLVQVAQATQVKQGTPEAPVRVIVYGSGAQAALASMKAKMITSLSLIDAYSGEIRASRLGRLGLASGVTKVVVDSPVKATADPYAGLVTLFARTSGATTAWAAGLNGQGVSVAVLDSGVSPSAMDLGSRLVQVKLPSQGATKVDDAVGHGTFVSEVLAGSAADGRHAGVATGAKVYGINVATSGSVYTTDIINGLAWVLANKLTTNIKVVNLSLAESVPSSYMTSALDQAVQKLWLAGITVVVSSGNLGPNSMYYAPGNDPFVITVGASDSHDTVDTADDTLAGFSSYGVTSDGFTKPEIVATGRHIVSIVPSASILDYAAPDANHVEPGYIMANGTSFATPQVTAAAAILLQKNPLLTPSQIKWLLTTTGRPVSGSTAPGLDLAAALAFTGAPLSANQGVALSTGAALAVTDKAGSLAAGAVKDALNLQKAATKFETNSSWQQAGNSWKLAADAWATAGNLAAAATDYDLAGRAYGLAGAFAQAAEAWTLASTPRRGETGGVRRVPAPDGVPPARHGRCLQPRVTQLRGRGHARAGLHVRDRRGDGHRGADGGDQPPGQTRPHESRRLRCRPVGPRRRLRDRVLPRDDDIGDVPAAEARPVGRGRRRLHASTSACSASRSARRRTKPSSRSGTSASAG